MVARLDAASREFDQATANHGGLAVGDDQTADNPRWRRRLVAIRR
jgi:hypothetical protein